MSFDKRKEFERIDEMLNEVRIACNRAMIPFVWVAAVYDDGRQTEYKVAVDENEKPADDDGKKYICNSLVPGSMGVTLQDDKIRDIIKVLNGFQVVAKEMPLTINQEDLSYSRLFPRNELYEFDEQEGVMVMPANEKVTVVMESEDDCPKAPITVNGFANNSLPHNDGDFQ